jgi:hypothetical protein
VIDLNVGQNILSVSMPGTLAAVPRSTIVSRMHHGRKKYNLFFIIERRNSGNAIGIMVRIDGLNAHPELYKAQMD